MNTKTPSKNFQHWATQWSNLVPKFMRDEVSLIEFFRQTNEIRKGLREVENLPTDSHTVDNLIAQFVDGKKDEMTTVLDFCKDYLSTLRVRVYNVNKTIQEKSPIVLVVDIKKINQKVHSILFAFQNQDIQRRRENEKKQVVQEWWQACRDIADAKENYTVIDFAAAAVRTLKALRPQTQDRLLLGRKLLAIQSGKTIAALECDLIKNQDFISLVNNTILAAKKIDPDGYWDDCKLPNWPCCMNNF